MRNEWIMKLVGRPNSCNSLYWVIGKINQCQLDKKPIAHFCSHDMLRAFPELASFGKKVRVKITRTPRPRAVKMRVTKQESNWCTVLFPDRYGYISFHPIECACMWLNRLLDLKDFRDTRTVWVTLKRIKE